MNRVALSIVIIGSLSFYTCKQKPPPPTPPTPVNLQTVTTQMVTYYDNYPATTQALSQVDIRPEVQGYITGIFFNDGDNVRKGQKLYEIDKRLYEEAYDQAVANLKVAHGNTVQAKQDADRYEYLNSYNAVAKQTLDHAVIALENAQNQEQAAEQMVKTAATNLTFSTIVAPFDGTMGFSQVRLGNMVTVGSTVLNTISTNDPMAVDFLVNEKQIPHFEAIMNGKQATIDSMLTVLLPDNSLYPGLGSITVIDRAVDAQTGAIRVRAVFPNHKYALKVGMSCTMRVHNEEKTPQMLIPYKAVVEQMGEYFVFIAKDTIMKPAADSAKSASAGSSSPSESKSDTSNKKSDTAANKPKWRAFQRKIQLGQTIGPNVIVLGGLRPGDKIVVDGVQAIHDGSEIGISKKPAQGSPNSSGGGTTDSTNNTGSAGTKDKPGSN